MASGTSNDDVTVPVVSVNAGDYVFRTGDPADAFYIISTGLIELLRRDQTHGRLALLAAGDLCGEDSAFEGQVRACDARALSASTLLRLTPVAFRELVRVRPEIAGVVMSRIAMRLVQARAASLTMAQPLADGQRATARFIHVESGSQFPLPDGSDIVVGRADPFGSSTPPGVELSAVDAHHSLSRHHALVKRTENGYQIREEPEVANGTFVNGTRLNPGVAVPIRDGDEVCFGLIRTVFRIT